MLWDMDNGSKVNGSSGQRDEHQHKSDQPL